MKKLMQFFDAERFFAAKRLTVTGCKPWVDFSSKATLGTKIDVVIIEDKTEYRLKDGETASNLFEKFSAKVPKQLAVPTGTEITLVNPVGTVYGEYNAKLSVVADDIKVVGQNNQTK